MTLIYLIYLLQLTILNERLSQGPAVLSSVDVFIPFVREFFLYIFCYITTTQNFISTKILFEGLHVHHTTTPSFCLGGEFQNRRRIIRTGTSTSKYEKKNCLSYTTSTYRGRFLFFVQQCEKNCIILHNLNGRVLI